MKKIISAISGGLDSAVATALLKEKGYKVVALFLKFYRKDFKGNEKRCCSPMAERRAREVAKILKIPFFSFCIKKEFEKEVINYFLKEIKKGKTPNPCIVCNKKIKFGLLLKKAFSLEGDFLATGHYAKIKKKNNYFHLFRAKDKKRDQSYFLYSLDQNQLSKIIFPLGDLKKEEVKKLAQKFKLKPVLNIFESRELCFVEKDLFSFLRKHLGLKEGKILDKNKKEIGVHQGAFLYTIGQRKGLSLSGGPFYVLKKDLKRNLLIVSKNEKDLFKKETIAEKISWIVSEPKLPLLVKVKIRYKSPLISAILKEKLGPQKFKIIFKKPQRAPTPGQAIVFYKGEEVLGGGIIKSSR